MDPNSDHYWTPVGGPMDPNSDHYWLPIGGPKWVALMISIGLPMGVPLSALWVPHKHPLWGALWKLKGIRYRTNFKDPMMITIELGLGPRNG